MGEVNILGVNLNPLKIIPLNEGDVFHGMKKSDDDYKGFGEAYFSTVNYNAVKGWKRHNLMTLNIIVPVGEIKFVLYDDRKDSITNGNYFSVNLSRENYQRLTVPPMVWMAFKGVGENLNLLLNLADIPHEPSESDKLFLSDINYKWHE